MLVITAVAVEATRGWRHRLSGLTLRDIGATDRTTQIFGRGAADELAAAPARVEHESRRAVICARRPSARISS